MKKAIFNGDGYEIIFEINNWAEKSNASVLTKAKETVVLTTAVLGEEHPELDFVPLTVEYEERYYAVGKILGSRFIRRETRPSEIAILNARLIDRAIRSALPTNFRRALQITNLILSYDNQIEPGILALLGSSIAVNILGIDWFGPVGATQVASFNGQLKILPNKEEQEKSDFNLSLSNIKSRVNMIEFEGREIKETEILKAIEVGLEESMKIAKFIEENFQPNQKIGTLEVDLSEAKIVLENFLNEKNIDLEKVLFNNQEGEVSYNEVIRMILAGIDPSVGANVILAMRDKLKEVFKKNILEKKVRPDGRSLNEIRKLDGMVGVLPKAHGSALFFRGLTHILSSITLAPPGEELLVRTVEMEGYKRFMHHYNFPPFATGEIRSLKTISRREIGHGYLAEKALAPLIPSEEEFPYIIRVVSDVISSNGSTSMGSVSASSMALMDAGVPIERHIAGISLGIAYENEDNYEILTDIQGPEDFFGGMDFKVAGTEKGVTAIQLDVKIDGLTLKMIKESLQKAREALNELINFQKSVIAKPRESISNEIPRVKFFKIDPGKIGLLIGSGGRTIQEITNATKTKIDIKPDGMVYVIGDSEKDVEQAIIWSKVIVGDLKVGDFIKVKAIRYTPSGVIVELAPEKTAFLHISDIPHRNFAKIEQLITLGNEYEVKIKRIETDGKIYVSMLENAKHR